ncbi:CAZyme family GH18 [Paecilomyces variotii]|nr:CAZyme family GH18 [Paecilomyces variotii]
MFIFLALGLLVGQATALRFVMYIDQYHVTDLPDSSQTTGITHAIMGFANSTLFTSDPAGQYTPFQSVSSMRSRFSKDTKIMIAIGGWGDTSGFSAGAKDDASRTLYAKNVAAMLESVGADGVDIDWEYPGGNGQDYKQIPNSDKVSEIQTYPLFLQALRKAVGKDKLISIAVPGLHRDMIAFTNETGSKIWPSVDFVNVMSYDLMNRRDNVTKHHTSIQGSLQSVNNYTAIGLDPAKVNLGIAYYAKWFTTDPSSDCATHPIGCKVVSLENPDGSDNGKSGALTFEKANMAPPPSGLKTSTDGTCGFDKGTKCPSGQCCSQYGSCGTTSDFCNTGCMSDYGECKGISITDSWRRAQENGTTDKVAGGQYYWDSEVNIFWTWDTPALITQKFSDIVAAKKLGGVMAWSLGEDTYDWSHLDAMRKGVANSTSSTNRTSARIMH